MKIQKHGLFPFMAEKMFHLKDLEGDKASMDDLLKLIPELDGLFANFEGQSVFMKVENKGEYFSFPSKILDYFHMTENRFFDYYKTKSQVPFEIASKSGKEIGINLDLLTGKDFAPLRYNLEDGSFYFPTSKNKLQHYPEILIHYLLLYNLSMIARYELNGGVS